MFCFQCEQTRQSRGWLRPRSARAARKRIVSDLQDLLIHQLEGLGQYRKRLAARGRDRRGGGQLHRLSRCSPR